VSTRQVESVHAVAPAWHTLTLVGLILAVAITGALLRGRPEPVPPVAVMGRMAVYAQIAVVQAMLVVYVSKVGRGPSVLGSLLGPRAARASGATPDIAVGIVAFLLIEGTAFAWSARTGTPTTRAAVLPVSLAERGVWSGLAVLVAFGEEVVYRGYLFVQLAAFAQSRVVGLVLQAALFGVAHADQGAAAALGSAVYGIILGGAAWWRASLVPCIVSHAMVDAASGWLVP
jgi:membrane protease YdiL (CAAX protease family)